MLYDSSKKFNFNNHASFLFELSAYLFTDMGIETLDFAYIDVNNGTLPEKLINEAQLYPYIQLLPAGQKDKTPYPSANITEIEDLLSFIKEVAETDVSRVFDEIEEMERTQEAKNGEEEQSQQDNVGQQVESDEDQKREDL